MTPRTTPPAGGLPCARVDTAQAIDALDDLVHNARPVPLTDQVRLHPDELHRAVEQLRRAVTAEFGLLPGPELDGVAAIEALAAEAKRIRLTPDVRLDRRGLTRKLDELRLELPEQVAAKSGEPNERPPGAAALVAISELDELVHNARIVPLTDQVRLERAEFETRIAALREQVANNGRALAVVERLETVVADAKPVPMTDQIRVLKTRLYDLLGELRVIARDDLRASQRPS